MRISDWSSDVCSSDRIAVAPRWFIDRGAGDLDQQALLPIDPLDVFRDIAHHLAFRARSDLVNGFEVVKAGEGPSPTDEDIVLIKYTGRLSDGTVFDQQEQAPLPVAGSVPGFSKALKKLQRGGKYKIVKIGRASGRERVCQYV